jgi:hypothetical protein
MISWNITSGSAWRMSGAAAGVRSPRSVVKWRANAWSVSSRPSTVRTASAARSTPASTASAWLKIAAGTSRPRWAPSLTESREPIGIVTCWPDIRRPVKTDPDGATPTARASESETRFTPIPVSTMNRVSVSPTQTGTVRRCIRYWNGTVEKIANCRVRSKGRA